MLTIFADGIARVALLIFKGVLDSKWKRVQTEREIEQPEERIAQYLSGVKVIFNKNANSSDKVILIWLKEILLPSFDDALPSLVALNAAHFQKAPAVRVLLKRHIFNPLIILVGCASMPQNLEVVAN